MQENVGLSSTEFEFQIMIWILNIGYYIYKIGMDLGVV